MDKRRDDFALKELDIALANRVFEIQSFWQRSNYFLVLLTALGAATFTVADSLIQIILAIASAVCSILWYRTNLGSKFWQESWEVEVNLLSDEIGIESFKRPIKEVEAQVRKSLGVDQKKKRGFRNYINRQIASKPSVTVNMISLSLLISAVWSIIAAVFVVRQLIIYLPKLISCIC